MPAMLDDPASPPIYRQSGQPPFPDPHNPQLPPSISPRSVTLRDRVTAATIVPFCCPSQVPQTLLSYLCDQLNREIEKGDTYPMLEPFSLDHFGTYWFSNFGVVMLLGNISDFQAFTSLAQATTDWSKLCLGSFYIKPNYPGRSSHICNGGFLVTDASRNRGVGRLMGECYIDWAPRLGYTYSVFNLVYETNVASCRIWDALGFKRIGRVKGCGQLKSHPGELIDAIIYGRDLGDEADDFISEERFDKIRYYLKHGKYPAGADRAEKSRLRSAATHYKLVPSPHNNGDDVLMLKDKEVIAEPAAQYEIARKVHTVNHGGINKTTATIAEKYHWVRIKETVSTVIKNCPECKELNKSTSASRSLANNNSNNNNQSNNGINATNTVNQPPSQNPTPDHSTSQSIATSPQLQAQNLQHLQLEDHTMTDASPFSSSTQSGQHTPSFAALPLDPRIMTNLQQPTRNPIFSPPPPYQRNTQSMHPGHRLPLPLAAHSNQATQSHTPIPSSSSDASPLSAAGLSSPHSSSLRSTENLLVADSLGSVVSVQIPTNMDLSGDFSSAAASLNQSLNSSLSPEVNGLASTSETGGNEMNPALGMGSNEDSGFVTAAMGGSDFGSELVWGPMDNVMMGGQNGGSQDRQRGNR